MESTQQVDNLRGNFRKIIHLRDLFLYIKDFLGDYQSLLNIINLNSYFRKLLIPDIKTLDIIIEYLKETKYSVFSPYSWLRNPTTFEDNKLRSFFKINQFLESKNIAKKIDENDFKILFNFCKRFKKTLDFELFGLNSGSITLLSKYLNSFNDIYVINLSNNDISDEAFCSLYCPFIEKCHNLEELILEGNYLTGKCCENFVKVLKNKKNFRSLNLKGNSIGDGVIYFKQLLKERAISLNIAWNRLDRDMIDEFSSSILPIDNLLSMDISMNAIKGNSAFFKSFKKLNNIQVLLIENCSLDDDDVSNIKNLISENKSITYLSIALNAITNIKPIIDALKINETLTTLDISHCNQIVGFNKLLENLSEFSLTSLKCRGMFNLEDQAVISTLQNISKNPKVGSIKLFSGYFDNSTILELIS